MKFKEIHKTALSKVLSDLIQSDGLVNQGEMDYLAHIHKTLRITPPSIKKSASISLSTALSHLKTLDTLEKMAILKMLQSLSTSDDCLDANESLLVAAILLSIQIELPETEGIHADLVSIPNLAFDTQNAVLYVESSYDATINGKIESQHDAICQLLKSSQRTFFYLPKVINEIQSKSATLKDTLNYLEPTLTHEQLQLIVTNAELLSCETFSKEIFLNYLNFNGFNLEKPSFLFKIVNKMPSRYQNFLILEIGDDPLETLERFYQVKNSINELNINGLTEKELRSLKKLDFKAQHEAKDDVQYTGFHKVVIDTLLKYNSGKGLSRLFVKENGSICLKDRNYLEIKMNAISKALYILFLKHEEGIRLNYLVDYKNQLLRIYKHISTYSDEKLLKQAVENIVDVTGTTLNANISRIKKAFTDVLGEDAKDYLIQGERNEPKAIPFDRKLVEFEKSDVFD